MDLPRFAVEVRPGRARVQLVLSGELDLASVTEVRTALEDLRDASYEDVVVDVRGVTFVDSSGLAALVAADERARREGWRFAITTDSRPLERLLELACLSTTLQRA